MINWFTHLVEKVVVYLFKLVNLVNFVMQFLKWTKWTKWTEQIFVESAESAKSAKSIFATFATFASEIFVGKESCKSTVRYALWSRISLTKPLQNPYLTLTRFRLSLGSNLSCFSLASLICLCMLTVGVGNVWGTETTYTSRTSAGTNTKVIDTSNAWTASLGASYNASGAYWACNQGSRTITITCTGISDPITDIVVSGKRNKEFTYSISATVGGSTFGTTFTKSTTGDYTTNTLSNASGMSGTVVLTITSAGATSGGGSIWVSSITVTTKASCTLSSISLNTTSVQKTFCVGDAFNSTGLVTTASYTGGCSDATVTPTSVSSPDMASAGEKTVTVSYTEGGVTKTATYTITVNAKYSVTWMVNGSSYSTGSPTTQVCPGSHVTSLPTAPNPPTYGCGDKFVGWTTVQNYVHGTSPLYTTASEFPNATDDQVFYAVYADYVE